MKIGPTLKENKRVNKYGKVVAKIKVAGRSRKESESKGQAIGKICQKPSGNAKSGSSLKGKPLLMTTSNVRLFFHQPLQLSRIVMRV